MAARMSTRLASAGVSGTGTRYSKNDTAATAGKAALPYKDVDGGNRKLTGHVITRLLSYRVS